jgi:uncharacterized protein (DUF2132 family)
MSDKKSKTEANEASVFPTSPETNSDLAAPTETIADSADADSQDKNTQANNPLHGVKLQAIIEDLEQQYGWDGLAYRININCFKSDPSIKSSLKFLRRTPWARDKVERLYLKTFHKKYRPESY